MKRFYKDVTTRADETGALVLLDGRVLRTPARQPLLLPTAELAAIVAQEWAAQSETIEPAQMPLTRYATTGVDLMPARRDDAAAEAADFARTDLLCYRVSQPANLAARQDAVWQPWLDWAERRFDARLQVTREIQPVAQPALAVHALRRAVETLDSWRLVGLHAGTTLSGSLVLGFALLEGALPADAAFEAALLDELYGVEQWGLEEAQQRRHAALRRDLAAAALFARSLDRLPAGDPTSDSTFASPGRLQ